MLRTPPLQRPCGCSAPHLHPPAVRSGEHCRISRSDEDRDVYLYDLSSNGTYVNGVLVGKDSRKLLGHGDTITLLDPAKPNHYQFIFQDQRPKPPPEPAAPARLLQNTSFCAGGASEDSGSASYYDEVCELGRGAFAVVKKVVHRRTGQKFAMKVMDKKKLLGQLRRKSGVQVPQPPRTVWGRWGRVAVGLARGTSKCAPVGRSMR